MTSDIITIHSDVPLCCENENAAEAVYVKTPESNHCSQKWKHFTRIMLLNILYGEVMLKCMSHVGFNDFCCGVLGFND